MKVTIEYDGIYDVDTVARTVTVAGTNIEVSGCGVAYLLQLADEKVAFIRQVFSGKNPHYQPLPPDQRIRVLINGVGVHCYVRDVCSKEVRLVVDAIAKERLDGKQITGLLMRVSEKPLIDIQVDLV